MLWRILRTCEHRLLVKNCSTGARMPHQIHTHTLPQAHSPAGCPTRRSVICVWLPSCIFLCLCWLVARPRKSYRRRRQRHSALTRCCMSGLFPAAAWPQDVSQSEEKKKKKKNSRSPSSSLLLTSAGVLSDSGKNLPQVFKKRDSLWRQQPGHEPRCFVSTGTVKHCSFWSH